VYATGGWAGEFPSDCFVYYLGWKTEIDMHLKGSNRRDPRYCFRVYFFWSNREQARSRGVAAIASGEPDNLMDRGRAVGMIQTPKLAQGLD
jgi:hypothetical protein